MLHTRRVGIVSPVWTAEVHRLTRGALSYADSHPGIVLREFHVTRDFKPAAGSPAGLPALFKWQPDGLLCYFEQRELEHLLRLLPRKIPLVNACASRPQPGVAVVAGDFPTQARTVVNHLQHQGLRSLALLMLEDVPNMQTNMVDAFNRLVRPTNPAAASFFQEIPPALLDDLEAPVRPVPPRLAAWLRKLPKPVGIFCPQSGGGNYVVRVCHALGLAMPKDIRVVGADDADISLACSPTLTSVISNSNQIGQESLRVLDQMMAGQPAPPEIVRIGTSDLHVRESTGLLRGEICDIAAALDYIEQKACHGISVKQLVQDTQNVSAVTFYKYFLAATGSTPGAAILHRQLETARSLLARSELSLTMIADHCGFGGSSDFSRRFRAVQGVTPTDYRKQQIELANQPAPRAGRRNNARR